MASIICLRGGLSRRLQCITNVSRFMCTAKQGLGGSGAKILDLSTEYDQLNDVQKHFVAKFERQNEKVATTAHFLKNRTRKFITFLFVVIFSIYFYTMYKVKQDDFLEELPPEGFRRKEDE